MVMPISEAVEKIESDLADSLLEVIGEATSLKDLRGQLRNWYDRTFSMISETLDSVGSKFYPDFTQELGLGPWANKRAIWVAVEDIHRQLYALVLNSIENHHPLKDSGWSLYLALCEPLNLTEMEHALSKVFESLRVVEEYNALQEVYYTHMDAADWKWNGEYPHIRFIVHLYKKNRTEKRLATTK